jgi:hypothetical protein
MAVSSRSVTPPCECVDRDRDRRPPDVGVRMVVQQLRLYDLGRVLSGS